MYVHTDAYETNEVGVIYRVLLQSDEFYFIDTHQEHYTQYPFTSMSAAIILF